LSLRALFLVTLIAGIYFALGRLTASKGARDVSSHLAASEDRPQFATEFVAPFVYRNESVVASTDDPPQETTRQNYYFWFFGHVARMPIEKHRTTAVSLAVEDEFEETYFPIRSASSQHKTAVPVKEWRMPYGDQPSGK
jgi:hypothetical protein